MSENSSMLEQLGLLRNLLLRVLGVTILIFICLAFFQDSIYLSISEPLIRFLPDNSSMIATEVTSPFLTPLKLTFYMAIFVAVPYLMFELWRFVTPGLFKSEKIYTIGLTGLSTLLFYLGTFFAFYAVFPLIFSFCTFIYLSYYVEPFFTFLKSFFEYTITLSLGSRKILEPGLSFFSKADKLNDVRV